MKKLVNKPDTPGFGYNPIVRWLSRWVKQSKCDRCNGTREVEVTIGGDGYGDRCCGEMDVMVPCPECKEEEGS